MREINSEFEQLIEEMCGPEPPSDAPKEKKREWVNEFSKIRISWIKNFIEYTDIAQALHPNERSQIIDFLERKMNRDFCNPTNYECDCGAQYIVYMKPVDISDHMVDGRLPYDRMWQGDFAMSSPYNWQTALRCMFCDKYFIVRGGKVIDVEIERMNMRMYKWD